VAVHDHHNDPDDPINRSKAKARYPESDPAALALDRRMGAGLIGLLALIMFGGLIVTLFEIVTDPIATRNISGSSGSRTTTGVGHSSPLTNLSRNR
jgi:hypothetical protein